MIYRILVDNGWGMLDVPAGLSPTQLLEDLHRKGIVPADLLHRLGRLSHSRLAVETSPDGQRTLRLALPPRLPAERRMAGAGFGALANVMDAKGLQAPAIANPRTRFYFTELGWQRVGRFVAGRARQLGHVVKIIRRKNPRPSEIFYRDAYQLALLPSRLGRRSVPGPESRHHSF